MQNDIELVREEKRRGGGIGFAVGLSFALHALLLIAFVSIKPVAQTQQQTPIARYVELIKQNPDNEFVEAPGRKIDKAPITAPLSDANRKAAMPEPTGDEPTTRPGDGRGLYHPPMGSPDSQPAPRAASPAQNPQQASAPSTSNGTAPPREQADPAQTTFRVPTEVTQASAAINWKAAIKEVGQVASLGGKQGLEGAIGGGEKGYTAEAGPLSFETKWFDWGDYAQSMVSRIRIQWYSQMPPLVRTGMKGNVTIRFVIHRDGRISDVEILESSGIPPYDFAARKAIEAASPLNPLPKDFPNPDERVVAIFYYNMQAPSRG
ncbi:MAG TPA: TonB family protein [Thermoanaerobaculia bacterium]